MPYQPPRGTFDVLPREMVGRNIVIEKIRGVIEKYGYEPMDTPAFESWRLLEVKCGEDIKEQIYRFEDKKGRELGLRYDLTVPLARVIASNPQLPKPFKRYSISRVWRYEKPTASRRREFLQCDADIVGSSEPLSDAEVIALGAECLKTLGLATLLVRLNNRKVLEGLLELAKIDAKKKLDVFRAMDKLAKIGRNGVLEELRRIGVPALPSRRLLDLMGKRGEPTEVLTHARRLLRGIRIGEEGCEELHQIAESLKDLGLPEGSLLIDLSLARGIDYYTGPIFEILIEGDEELGSVAGGGRYDTLIELCGGRPTPATGISLGMERIFEILSRRGLFPSPKSIRVFVASADESVRSKATRVAQMLRRSQIPADLDLANRRLSAQLEYANKRGFAFTVIVGKRELRRGEVVVRNMVTKSQRNVKLDELPGIIKGLI